jgi:hypothetical protein
LPSFKVFLISIKNLSPQASIREAAPPCRASQAVMFLDRCDNRNEFVTYTSSDAQCPQPYSFIEGIFRSAEDWLQFTLDRPCT